MKENNLLLAKFLGGQTKGESFFLSLNDNEIFIPKLGLYHLGNNGKILKFHSDWNWLMLVVKKCYEVEHNENEYYEAIYYAVADLDITKTYNACVEFIKWYNDNKQI